MKSEHIIECVHNFRRQTDYDGYNDFYVNPEWQVARTRTMRERNLTKEDELTPDIIW